MGKYDKIRKYQLGGTSEVVNDPIQIGQGLTPIKKAGFFQEMGYNLKDSFKNGFVNSGGMQMLQNIKANPWSAVSAVAEKGINAATDALVGDKNFDEQSQAVDELANEASNIAKNFGPWGQVAALGIQAVNAADKLAGSTVPGYKVDLDSSGFSGIQTEVKDKSNRVTQMRNIDKQMDRRNQQAQMALAAAQLDKENDFMTQARAASVKDVMDRNKNALNGGLGTDALGA